MELNGHKCECCDEETFTLEFSYQEAFIERQGCAIEFDREGLEHLMEAIQRALLGKAIKEPTEAE